METNAEFSRVVTLPQFPGPSRVTRTNAPADPHEATTVTIDRMKQIAAADANSPQVLKATRQALVLAGPSDRDRSCAIYRWICRNVKFREDDAVLRICLGLENELELLIAPAQLLSMRPPAGDCDCLTTLCMSMHLAAGIPIEPITIKADHEEPDRDSHVYCQAHLADGPLVLDPAQGSKHGWQPGDEAPGWYSKDEWGVIQPSRTGRGLQGLGLGQDPIDPSTAADYLDLVNSATPGDLVTTTPAPSSTGINWNALVQSLAAGGLNIAKMQATPVGYVQQPSGAYANYGAGGTSAINLGVGSISPLLLLGGGALLIFMLARK